MSLGTSGPARAVAEWRGVEALLKPTRETIVDGGGILKALELLSHPGELLE
jgi:hypothetical protein